MFTFNERTKQILFLSFSIMVILSSQVLSAENISSPFLRAKFSLNGLETSNYKNVSLLIESLTEDAEKIGLTEERIKTKCELRLRQSGLNPSSDRRFEHLYVNISVVSQALNIRIDFKRPVLFEVGKKRYRKMASTWCESITGTHGDNPEFIIQSLNELLDMFLNEYLKANSK